MRYLIMLCAAVALLSACRSGTRTYDREMREARAMNGALQKEAFAAMRQVQIDGLTFNVARLDGAYTRVVLGPVVPGQSMFDRPTAVRFVQKPYALVELARPADAPYTSVQVERAASRATGCQGEFALGVLAFVGGAQAGPLDLRALGQKVTSKVRGWRVDLSC